MGRPHPLRLQFAVEDQLLQASYRCELATASLYQRPRARHAGRAAEGQPGTNVGQRPYFGSLLALGASHVQRAAFSSNLHYMRSSAHKSAKPNRYLPFRCYRLPQL